MTERINVVAIDDDDGDAAILRGFLDQIANYQVGFAHVTNLEDARAALAEADVDIVFLDYRLGEHTGLEILRALRSSGELLPIVALTGQGDEYLAAELIRSGADDYLAKADFNPEMLRRAIDNATTQHRRRKTEAENQRLLQEIQAKNEALETTNRRLAEMYETAHDFVDTVSHEFRTPLTVIKELTSVMHDGLAGETTPEQKEYLGTVRNRVEDLAAMIDDMLDTSRLEAGLLAVSRRQVRVEDVVERVRTVLERKASGANVGLDIALDPNLPIVYCDPEKIGRVLINLIVNAIKFSDEGNRVRLWARCRSEEAQVRLGVTDYGQGIDQDSLALIFDRFKQAEGGVRSSTKGFGLGLNIAKELVRVNFGDIDVESEPGRGSTFSFTVPTTDPRNLMKRFLKRVEDLRDGASFVSIADVRLDSAGGENLLDEAEEFLQHQIRCNDLLFRARPAAWLLVAAGNAGDLSSVIRRVDQAWQEANRNRAGERLPAAQFHVQGTWSIHQQAKEFIDAFKQASRPVEPADAASAPSVPV